MASCTAPAPAAMPEAYGLLSRLFGLDLRSLAAFRIGMGILVLVGLAYRVEDLTAHYSDDGALPRAARVCLNAHEQFTAPPFWISLHMLSGAVWFQAVLFTVAAVLAVGVTVGYRTTWSLFGSWILLISLQARNPLVLQGGDDLLRLMLFWAWLAPCGAVWSLDARRQRAGAPRWYASLATAGLLLQLASMYVFTALLKTGASWRVDFDAIYYALALDHFTTPFGYWLLGYPAWLKVLTALTLALEFLGPLLLFLPWRNSALRVGVFLSFVALHVGIGLTMHLGMFPWICVVCWLIVLPSSCWEMRWQRQDSPTTKCGQSAVAGLPARLGWFGNAIAGALLVHMLLLNVARLQGGIESRLNAGPIRWVGSVLAQDQYWCMFSPGPMQFGGWLRVEGVRADGSRVNLLHMDHPPFETKPAVVAATYPSNRWRKYLMNMLERKSPVHRTGIAQYLLRRWKANHPDDAGFRSVEVICMCTPTPPPGVVHVASTEPQAILIWRHQVM